MTLRPETPREGPASHESATVRLIESLRGKKFSEKNRAVVNQIVKQISMELITTGVVKTVSAIGGPFAILALLPLKARSVYKLAKEKVQSQIDAARLGISERLLGKIREQAFDATSVSGDIHKFLDGAPEEDAAMQQLLETLAALEAEAEVAAALVAPLVAKMEANTATADDFAHYENDLRSFERTTEVSVQGMKEVETSTEETTAPSIAANAATTASDVNGAARDVVEGTGAAAEAATETGKPPALSLAYMRPEKLGDDMVPHFRITSDGKDTDISLDPKSLAAEIAAAAPTVNLPEAYRTLLLGLASASMKEGQLQIATYGSDGLQRIESPKQTLLREIQEATPEELRGRKWEDFNPVLSREPDDPDRRAYYDAFERGLSSVQNGQLKLDKPSVQAFEQALKLGGAPRNLDNAVLGILMTVAAQAVKDNIKAKARAAGYDALPDAVFTTVKRHTNVTVSEILAAVR